MAGSKKGAAKAAAGKGQSKGGKSAPKAAKKCAPTCKELYEKHQKLLANSKDKIGKGMTPTDAIGKEQQRDLARFQKNYAANQGRYESVSKQTGIPPKLVASLHYRESSSNFGTYLHQGDPLGKPAVNEPSNIPVFGKDQWEDAAVHALNDKDKKKCQEELGIDENTTDQAKLAAYAERYNGLGYNNAGRTSPYVYSGTNQYSAGKYVADSKFSATAVDEQVGVVPLLNSLP